MRIMIAEDDARLRAVVAAAFREGGFEVDEAADGAEALYLAEQDVYDLLILDITMPVMTGMQVLEQLRANNFAVPVLLLTARDGIPDRVAGLKAGADDYLVKPFALSELEARVSALIRRSVGASPSRTLVSGQLTLDLSTHEATFGGTPLALTQKEFEFLEYLLMNRGRILTRGQICQRLWGYDSDISFGLLEVHVHNLRKKLAAAGCEGVIRTMRGLGYLYSEEQ